MVMNKMKIVLLLFFIYLFYGCYQDMALDEDLIGQDIECHYYDERPSMSFGAILRETNGGNVVGMKNASFLPSNNVGLIKQFGDHLYSEIPALGRMTYTLSRKFKFEFTIAYAVDYNLASTGDPMLVGKDAYYDSDRSIVFVKDAEYAMSERVILHELLHAFQVSLLDIKFNDKNVDYTEFEVLLVYDVMQYIMCKGGFRNFEGGGSEEYKSFIATLAQLSYPIMVGEEDKILKKFKMFYQRWVCSQMREPEQISYKPSLLFSFLSNK